MLEQAWCPEFEPWNPGKKSGAVVCICSPVVLALLRQDGAGQRRASKPGVCGGEAEPRETLPQTKETASS